jgi:cytochrome P450
MQVLPPKFDALDPAVLEDPYPTYAGLRRAGPLCRGGPGQWVVTRYADVAALLHDPGLGHQFPREYHRFSAGDGAAGEFFQRILLDRDPPDHTRLRRLMAAAFSPTLVRRLGDHIGDLVDELLAPALDRHRLDAVRDLASPLPVTVVCELLGIPAADRDLVRPRASDLCKAFGTYTPQSDRAAADAAVVWLRDYVGALLERRRAHPGDDLLSRMLAAVEGGSGLSYEEIVDNAVFLFFAGFETTMSLISTGCAALMRYPSELARLRADPALVPSAVEEFLRYDAPIQSVGRLVRRPREVCGRTIQAGRVLLLLLGSANHDEAQFACPGRLDVGRRPNPHVSFGGGSHFCLGAGLARVEAAVTFERLLRRFASIEPAGPQVRRPGTSLRAYASVPLAVKPA